MADANAPPALGVPLLCTAASLALIGDQLRLWWLGRSAEVAHLASLPPVALWAAMALMVLAALGVAIALRVRDPRLARLPLLALVLVIFVEAFVVGPVRPFDDTADGFASVQVFAELASDIAHDLDRVPASASELQPALSQLGSPAYLTRGEPVAKWQLSMRAGCDGPVLDVAGLAAGTLVYCLARDRQRAWVTGVGRTTPRFGPPELLTVHGKPAVGVVKLAPPEPPPHD